MIHTPYFMMMITKCTSLLKSVFVLIVFLGHGYQSVDFGYKDIKPTIEVLYVDLLSREFGLCRSLDDKDKIE